MTRAERKIILESYFSTLAELRVTDGIPIASVIALPCSKLRIREALRHLANDCPGDPLIIPAVKYGYSSLSSFLPHGEFVRVMFLQRIVDDRVSDRFAEPIKLRKNVNKLKHKLAMIDEIKQLDMQEIDEYLHEQNLYEPEREEPDMEDMSDDEAEVVASEFLRIAKRLNKKQKRE